MTDASMDVETTPILEFVPVSCRVDLQQQLTDSPRSTVSMKLRLSGRDTVETPEGRSLNCIDWSITFHEGSVTSERVKAYRAIGMLAHFPEVDEFGEAGSAWAYLDEDRFALLTKCTLAGRLPSVIRVHVAGLSYGTDPDGEGKVWDVNAKRSAPLKQVEVGIDLVPPDQGADVVSLQPVATAEAGGPEKSSDASLERISRRLGWVVFFAACAALAAIFR